MRTIKLTVEQAKTLYNSNKELRDDVLKDFTNEELGIRPYLKNWIDLDFTNTYYPQHNGDIKHGKTPPRLFTFLSVPSEKHAKSMIAFAKLSMLMADLGDETNVDWNGDNDEEKHIILYDEFGIDTYVAYHNYTFLAFKTKSICEEFKDKHIDLIKEYFMID